MVWIPSKLLVIVYKYLFQVSYSSMVEGEEGGGGGAAEDASYSSMVEGGGGGATEQAVGTGGLTGK